MAVGAMQLLALVVTSRLLKPHEVGLFAMVTLLSTIVEKVGHLGVAPALVQKLNIQPKDQRVANSFALFLGGAISTLLFLFRNEIAIFLGDLQLAEFLPGASIIILLDSLLSTSESLLQRDMKFKKLSWCDMLSYAAGNLCTAVALSALGFGTWSLIIAAIVVRLVKCSIFLRAYPPVFTYNVFNKESLELLKLGLGFSSGRVFNYLALQGDNFVVGRLLGASALGTYSRSYQLISLPADFIGKAFDKVWFAAMAKKQEDKNRLKTFYLASVEMVALACIPCAVYTLIFSEQIITLLLGEQWRNAVPIVQLLAPAVFFRAAYKPSETLLRSIGVVYPLARRQMLYAAGVICGVTIGVYTYGINGAAIGLLLALALHCAVVSHLVQIHLGISKIDLFKAHMPGVWCGVSLTLLMVALDLITAAYGLIGVIPLILKGVFTLPILLLLTVQAPSYCRALHAAQLIAPRITDSKLPQFLVSIIRSYARV